MGRQTFSIESSWRSQQSTWENDLKSLNDMERDEDIYQEIIDGFHKSSIRTDFIIVNVNSGVVVLRGIIDRFEEAIKLEEFVGQIEGVTKIRNELQVRS